MASQQKQITIKSKRQGSDDLRRVTLPIAGLTYDRVLTKLSSFYKTVNFETAKITYRDSDGDKITLSSDEELREAINVIGSGNVLRVFVSFEEPVPQNNAQQPAETRPTPSEKPSFIEALTQKLIENVQNPKVADDIRLVIQGITKELPPFFRSVHQLQHVIVSQLLRTLHNTSLRLMQTNEKSAVELAKQYLEAFLSIRPSNPTAAYNLACAESLLGNVEAAISSLVNSIRNGFHDVAHIKADADLSNLRNTDAFKTLVELLEARQQSFGGWHSRARSQCPMRRPRHGVNARKLFLEKVKIASKARHDKIVQEIAESRRNNFLAQIRKATQARKAQLLQEVQESRRNAVHAQMERAMASRRAQLVKEMQEAKERKQQEAAKAEPPVAPPLPQSRDVIPDAPFPVTQSQIARANAFSQAVETLEAMGFTDRRSNIQALIQGKVDVAAAVQILLNH